MNIVRQPGSLLRLHFLFTDQLDDIAMAVFVNGYDLLTRIFGEQVLQPAAATQAFLNTRA